MNRARAPPNKPRTPASEPSLADEWSRLYHQYTQEEGMKKSVALQRIASEHGLKTRGAIEYWIFQDVHLKQKSRVKRQQRSDRSTAAYRLKSATYQHLRRNLDQYLPKTFENTEDPLTLDDITLRIQHILESEGKPSILLRNKTLEKLASQYAPPILERVKGTEPPQYILNSDYT